MADAANHKEGTQGGSWFKGLKAEFHKISWTDRKSLVKQTIAVSVISVILGLIIALVDMVVQYGINFLIG